MARRFMSVAAVLVLATVLSACAQSPGADPGAGTAAGEPITVTVIVDTGHGMPTQTIVEGPAGMTVEEVMQAGEFDYTAIYNSQLGGYAMALLEATPDATDGELATPFWWLCINGEDAQTGMSSQQVSDGDTVGWSFVSSPSCPS